MSLSLKARQAILLIGICITLTSCAGMLKGISADQTEKLQIDYSDGFGTRDMKVASSNGELFAGTLIWIKELGSSGHYRGALIGSEGRTLQVELECNSFTTKCVGTARSDNGTLFFIK